MDNSDGHLHDVAVTPHWPFSDAQTSSTHLLCIPVKSNLPSTQYIKKDLAVFS